MGSSFSAAKSTGYLCCLKQTINFVTGRSRYRSIWTWPFTTTASICRCERIWLHIHAIISECELVDAASEISVSGAQRGGATKRLSAIVSRVAIRPGPQGHTRIDAQGWALGSERFKQQIEALGQRRAAFDGGGQAKKSEGGLILQVSIKYIKTHAKAGLYAKY